MKTIVDVAKEAGVSISTVSKVLNKRKDVSDETRAKVERIVKQLNYHSDSTARGLRIRRTMMLGVLVRYLEHEYYLRILAGIENAAEKRGYNVIICNCKLSIERERSLVKLFRRRQVDGLIFILPLMQDMELIKLTADGIQLAVVGRPVVGDFQAPVISADHEGGIYDTVMHLVQEHSKLRIAYIQGPPEFNDGFLGYCHALRDAGLPFTPELVGYTLSISEQEAGDALEKMIYLGHKPDAVVCFNDELALGVYRRAAVLGLKIPEDLTVTGVDDTRVSRCLTPGMTTIHIPTFEMGELVADELINSLEGIESNCNKRTLPTKLVIRNSCGCP